MPRCPFWTALVLVAAGAGMSDAAELRLLPGFARLDGPKARQRFLVEANDGGAFVADRTGDAAFRVADPAVASVSADGREPVPAQADRRRRAWRRREVLDRLARVPRPLRVDRRRDASPPPRRARGRLAPRRAAGRTAQTRPGAAGPGAGRLLRRARR